MGGLWADQKWRRIRGVSGVRDEPNLPLDASQEDMLMRFGEGAFLMSLMLEISRYRTLAQHMRDYVNRRDALLQLHNAPVEMQGLHAQHHMDHAEVMRVLPYARALESLIEEILDQAEENRHNTQALFATYNAFVAKHFPKAKIPILAPKVAVVPADTPQAGVV